MTPRQRLLAALHGEHVDRVPFTMYECMIPQCEAERAMRNRGMCIVTRDVSVYKIHHPNTRIWKELFTEGKREMIRTHYETTEGELTTLEEKHQDFTTHMKEKMWKGPEDYKKILSFLKDEVYEPNYAAAVQAQKHYGDDMMLFVEHWFEPLQELQTGFIMDLQDFCTEWMDSRDEILKLYDAVVDNRRRIYPILARAPGEFVNYGGNTVPEMIGLEVFKKYYVPHYNECAEVCHKHGKLVGCHFDANCGLLAEAINDSDLDVIEAFTPSPDTDMTLGEARAAWPDKVIWMNFPSSVHLKPDADVTQTTVELLEQVDNVDGLLMGITEDMPAHRWRKSCTAIMDGLDRHAEMHPEMYR